MAELTIRPEEIRDALERFVSSYTPDVASREEVGRVTEAGDGIASFENSVQDRKQIGIHHPNIPLWPDGRVGMLV